MQDNIKEFSNSVKVDVALSAAYFEYAREVIKDRALPKVEDGLKPVQRRIIYAMWIHNNRRTDRFSKSAKIVGNVMGEFHPHGDSALYGTMVRMAQEWSMGIPLIDKQGNFGSIDGDSPAAMRYTEARLSYYAHEFFTDFHKEITPMRPNYDGTLIEPTILPTRVPNLLVNGSYGIAVGVATSIPPHNLGEIIDALLAKLEGQSEEEIYSCVKGPDLPTGGTIIGAEKIPNIYRTGEGSLTVRGNYFFEDDFIIFNEIPYQIQKSEMIKRIARSIADKRIKDVVYVRDESDKEGIRIVFKLRNNANKDIVLNQIFANTSLQSNLRTCLFVLNENEEPEIFSLKKFLESFLRFRENTIIARSNFDLMKAQKRIHILLCLLILQDNIDEIVPKMSSFSDTEEARTWLKNKVWVCERLIPYLQTLGLDLEQNTNYVLSDEQIDYILELKLQNLVRVERNKVENEIITLRKKIESINEVLNSHEKRVEIIQKELEEIKKYALPRKTAIQFGHNAYEELDLVPPETVMVILGENGYIKRVPLEVYKVQNRGGRGKTGYHEVGVGMIANTRSRILFFSNKGLVYSIFGYQIPVADHNSKGRALVNFLNLEENEKILQMLIEPMNTERVMERVSEPMSEANANINEPIGNEQIHDILGSNEFKESAETICEENNESIIDEENLNIESESSDITDEALLDEEVEFGEELSNVENSKNFQNVEEEDISNDIFVLFVSKDGYVRKNSIDQFKNIRSNGKIYMSLEECQNLCQVIMCTNKDNLFIATSNGMAVCCPVSKFRCFTGRTSSGVIACRLSKGDSVVGAISVSNHESVLTVTSKGFGKITKVANYRVTNRGTKGVKNMKICPETGVIVSVLIIEDKDDIILSTVSGQTIRFPAEQVRRTSRNAKGVRLFRLENDTVITVDKISEE